MARVPDLATPLTLTPLELASGIVLGTDPPRPWSRGAAPPDCSPLDALEAAILPALHRTPCLVSFSGGRDSSLVLSAATRLARRHGLADPVPFTNRIDDAPSAQESSWQELLVSHLGLADWERPDFTDELDAVGPYAQRLLRRHGLVWPFNAHFHLPPIDAARGGALLTGIGGDELFAAARRSRLRMVMTGAARPRRNDVRLAAEAIAPLGLRERALARRRPVDFPWLRPEVRTEVTRAVAATAAREPGTPEPRLRWYRSLRYLRASLSSLAAPAAAGGVSIVHPLADEGLWAVVGRRAGPHGFTSRTAGMRELLADLLPAELLARPDKASFDEVFFSDHARAFALRWSGAGVPSALVDPEALRRHWLSGDPAAQSFLLLQAGWLADEGGCGSACDGVEQPLGGLG
jgi:asparagine synthase (glutamine-hydrolysing)